MPISYPAVWKMTLLENKNAHESRHTSITSDILRHTSTYFWLKDSQAAFLQAYCLLFLFAQFRALSSNSFPNAGTLYVCASFWKSEEILCGNDELKFL